MKTIISSAGGSLKSHFDLRFGRAAWFCLYDETTAETIFFENEYKDVNHGAGGKVVENVVAQGVKKVISGDFGPKAKELLEKFNIQMVMIQDDSQTINDIIDQLKN